MYRATTPTITFNIPVDLTEASEVYVTFAKDNVILTKTNADTERIIFRSCTAYCRLLWWLGAWYLV